MCMWFVPLTPESQHVKQEMYHYLALTSYSSCMPSLGKSAFTELLKAGNWKWPFLLTTDPFCHQALSILSANASLISLLTALLQAQLSSLESCSILQIDLLLSDLHPTLSFLHAAGRVLFKVTLLPKSFDALHPLIKPLSWL